MAVGSNGDIAWGFTNSVGDWSDLVMSIRCPAIPTKYQTPDGPRAFDVHDESIAVKGAAPVTLRARWTIWGPVVGPRSPTAASWRSSGWRTIRTCWPPTPRGSREARSVDEAMRLSVGAALAAENLVVGDRERPHRLDHLRRDPAARRLPRRRARPRGPTARAAGTAISDFDEHPRVVDPPDGRLWTANARVVGGEMLEQDRRRRLQRRHPRLDDPRRPAAARHGRRAGALRHPARQPLAVPRPLAHGLPRRAHRPTRRADRRARAAARQLVERSWTGRASADSVAYRLVRNFRLTVSRMAFDALTGRHCDGPRRPALRLRAPSAASRVRSGVWCTNARRTCSTRRIRRGTRFLLAAIDRTIDAADRRRRAAGRADVGRGQRRRHRASAGRGGAVAGPVPDHAARSAARRHLHAARAHAAHRARRNGSSLARP